MHTEKRFQCRHIFTDGHRCGSPTLLLETPDRSQPEQTHEDFCSSTTPRAGPIRAPAQRARTPPKPPSIFLYRKTAAPSRPPSARSSATSPPTRSRSATRSRARHRNRHSPHPRPHRAHRPPGAPFIAFLSHAMSGHRAKRDRLSPCCQFSLSTQQLAARATDPAW
jgi:hypothetical protein